MERKKYEKFIMNDFNTERDHIGTMLFKLNEEKIKDIPFFTESAWVWPKKEKFVMEDKPHSHEYEEVVTLFGSNPDDPKDLCGEVEFWFGDEKYTITNSSIIYVPKGVVHCPLIFHRVDRPIFHYIVGHSSKY
ncbi:MAG: hypothetical protein JW864_01910 [Spirochaetes bacterium]|nr:hypothetical protein [Spirochaetota bacterium]